MHVSERMSVRVLYCVCLQGPQSLAHCVQWLHPMVHYCYIERFTARFGQAKFAYDGLVLGSSQVLLLPQLPQKMMLCLKWSNLTRK